MPQHRSKKVDAAQVATGASRRHARRLANMPQDLAEAKLQKERAVALLRESQSERAKLDLAKARGELVSASEVHETLFRIGLVVKSTVKAWASSLPGRIEGMSAGQMAGVLDDETHRLLETITAEAGRAKC